MKPTLLVMVMLYLSHKGSGVNTSTSAVTGSQEPTSLPGSGGTLTEATCASIGYTNGCCVDFEENGCSPNGGSCFCDSSCYVLGDCCSDIQIIGCFGDGAGESGESGSVMPLTVQFSSPSVVTPETTDAVVELILQGLPAAMEPNSIETVYSVNVSTQPGTARDNEDFIPLETTVEFLPGETMKNVTISIIDDNVREGTEIFVVLLSNPSSGLSLGNPSVLSVTINDLFIEFNQTAYNLTEGKNATLTVMLIGDTVDSLENVFTTRVDLITVNGTATAGEDYTPFISTTITFLAGMTEWSTNISIVDDNIGEPMESFTIELRNPSSGAILRNSIATVVIATDMSFMFNSTNLLVNEGEDAVLTILRTGDVLNGITVDVTTVDGTAVAPIDYSTIFSTISFASGETQRDITIQTIEDSIQESSENFTVYLFQVASSVLIYDIATVEISADEIITTGFEATNYTVNEGDAVNLTVVLSGQNITVETTVMVSTVDGTATALDDYTSLNITLTFTAGETRKDINITTVDDSVAEGFRAFNVKLSNPSSGIMLGSSDVATIAILADVITIDFNPANYTVNEGENVTLRVLLTGDTPTSDINIDIRSNDGTAIAFDDYEFIYTTITFTAGEIETTFTIQTFDDILMESTERFTVTLEAIFFSSDAATQFGTRQAYVDIIDLDGTMVPEPVVNLMLDVFPSNSSVLVQWMDTQNIYDSELLYYVWLNVSARSVLLSHIFYTSLFSDGESSNFNFSTSDSIFGVNGIVIDVSVHASNNVGHGMSVEAAATVSGAFAPMVQNLVATARDDVLEPSAILEWNDSFQQVPPDQFLLGYSAYRLSESESTSEIPEVSEFSVNLTQTELNSSLLYDYVYTLSNLLFYTSYEFRLVAVYGTDESAPVTVLHTTSEGLPGTVQNLMFTLIAGRRGPVFNTSTNTYVLTAIMTWIEPLEPNGVIIMYQYSIIEFDTSEIISNGTTSGDATFVQTSIVVGAYTNYTVEVSASTRAGVGDAITAGPVTTPQAAPSAPRSVTVGSVTSTSAVVTWNTPDFPNGIIQHYTVSLSSGVMYNVTSLDLSLTLEDLAPNTVYSVEVYAVTIERGQSSNHVYFITTQGIPSAVQDLSAVFVVDGSEVFDFSSGLYSTTVNISWSQPFLLNGELSHYNYSIAQSSGETVVTEAYTVETSVSTVVNVEPFTTYIVSVSAVTGGGEGMEVNVSIISPEAAPSEPVEVSGYAISSDTIFLEWSEPESPNGIIRYYLVTYYPTEGSIDRGGSIENEITVNTSGTFVTLEMLNPYTDYTVVLVAVTVAEGNESDPVTVRTAEAAPSEPVKVSGHAISSDTIFLEWSEPESPNGIIRYYLVTYYPTEGSIDRGGSIENEITVNTSSTFVTLEMLNPYTDYTVVLVAVTVAEGNESDPVTVRTAEAAPSQPQSVMATQFLGPAAIQVQWQEPEFLNGIIQYYLVHYYPTDDSNITTTINTTNAATTSLVISMLSPYTNYTVTVVAVTVAEGEMSDPVMVRTAEAAPSAPVITMASNTSSTSIRIQWDPPSMLNGVIRGYLINYYATDNIDVVLNVTTPGDVLALEFSGLEIFTSYSLFIQALTIELGETSNIVNITTDEDVPSKPTNISEVEINSTSVLVSWENPSSPNGVLLYFTLTYRRVLNLNEYGEPQTLVVDANTHELVLTDLDEFTKYEVMVSVSTRIGESVPVFVTVVTDPDSASPPSFIDAMTIDSSSIQIMWGFPTEPRGIIQGYIITYKVVASEIEMEENVTLETQNDSSNQTIVIDMLTPFTCYNFRVSAYAFSDTDDPFQVHLGMDTEETEPVCTDESTPSQPLNFQLEQIEHDSNQLTARWMQPSSPNGIILYYSIHCNHSTTSLPTVVVSGDATMATLADLIPFTHYECYVIANTSMGEGEPSNISIAQTVEDVPSAPTDFTSVVLTAQSILLQWSAPAIPNGIIVGYMLMYSGENRDFGTKNYSDGEFNDTVTGLSPNVAYMLSLKASTRAGFGESSSIVARTFEAAPDESPQNIVATNITSTNLIITWQPPHPESQNGVIRTYIIRYNIRSNTNDSFISIETNTTDTTIQLMGLEIFTLYEVQVSAFTTAEGPSGTIVVQTDSDLPSAPQSVTYSNISSKSVNINWLPPVKSNGIIESYTLQYYIPPHQPPITIAGINSTMYLLDGLYPYTIYNVVIVALTDKGAGPASERLIVFTQEDRPENPPQNLTAISISAEEVSLLWSEPVASNGIIVGYELHYSNESYSTSENVSANGVPHTVSGLNEFTTYTFMVAAMTGVGTGPGASLNVTTAEAAPSAPPANIQGTNVSSTSLYITWNEPPFSDQNGIIRTYRVSYVVLSSSEFNDTITTTNENITLSDLEIYTLYLVRVSAVTVAEGPFDSIVVRTDSDLPTAPRIVQGVDITPTSVTVSWLPPVPANGAIEFYSISYSSLIDGNMSVINIPGSPYVLSGLMEHVNYTIVVYAHTDKGQGEGSQKIIIQTEESLPDVPTNFGVAVINSTALIVSWEPPDDPNGIVISYHLFISIDPRDAEYLNSDIQSEFEIAADNRGYILEGLHPFIEYHLQLSARTIAGMGITTSVLSATTLTEDPSEGVRDIDVQVNGLDSVTVSWLPPLLSNWNGEITSYFISWSPVSECNDQSPVNQTELLISSISLTNFFNPTHPRDVDTFERETVNVTGLKESTSYAFTVSVATSGGRNSPEFDVFGCNRTAAAIAPVISLQQPSGDTIEVVINEVLTLSVIVEKFNLPINIVWKFNGEEVSNRNIFSINLDEPPAVSIFSLNPASSPIESGIYEVVVNNSVGTERVVFNVTVTAPVSIIDPPFHTPVVVREEDSVNFTCFAIGFPPPDITWVDANNDTLSIETEDRITIDTPEPYRHISGYFYSTSRLEISSSRRTDLGDEYSCVASNIIQSEPVNERRVFTLTVTYPPTVEIADNRGVHQVGVETRDGVSGRISLSFIITEAYPPVQEDNITWTYVNGTNEERLDVISELVDLDERFSITIENGLQTLNIASLQLFDSGVYSLTASNEIGSSTTAINLTVHVEPVLLSMTVLRENVTFDEGQSTSFSCTADGFPPPIIVWLHNGTLVNTNFQQRFSTNVDLVDSNHRSHVPQAAMSTLLVRDLHLRDSGEYICRADPPVSGQSDVAVAPVLLSVKAQPIDYCLSMPCMNGGTCVSLEDGFLCECIEDRWRGAMCETVVIKDEPATVVSGPKVNSFPQIFKSVNLTCDVTGSPQPEITWYKNDKLLEGQRLTYLLIDEMELSDRGIYYCIASNRVQDPENPSVNVERQDQSDPAVLNIKGVVQYTSMLKYVQQTTRRKRQTDTLQNLLSLLSGYLSGVSISGSNATVYSVTTTTTSQSEAEPEAVPLLVTLLSPNGGNSFLLEQLQETLDSVAMVEDLVHLNLSFNSIERFDGCPAETTVLPALSIDGTPVILDWPEVDIGVNYTLQCPCGNLSAIGGDVNRNAYRFCGGNFTAGASWDRPIQQACNFSEATRRLCQITNLIDEPKEAIVTLENITNNEDKIGVLEVGITAVLLESLTDAVVVEQNISLSENLLAVVDNILDVEGDQLQQSQTESNSSARILDVVGRVVESIPIPENETEVIIPLRSFAVSVREIEPESFTGLTFSALLGDSFDFSQNNDSIDASLLVFEEQKAQPTASITIPEDIFGSLVTSTRNINLTVPRRIVHSIYLTDSLFSRREESEFQVGSIVISAAISGGVKVEGLENPIMIQFIKSPDVVNGTETMCNFWDIKADDGFGNWSDRGCWVVNETEEDVTCACDHLTNFAILLDVRPDNATQLPDELAKTLLAVSYIGAILSTILLTFTIITYISAKKLRSSVAGQLLINLCLALIGIYVMFIVAYHSTTVKPLCALTGGLLHYFILVTFSIMAAEAVNLYIKLVKVFGHNAIQHRYVLKTVLISWIVPFIIVIVSLAPNYRNYIGELICRPYNLPFYVGLITPFLAVYVFNWIMFLIIFISLLKQLLQKKEVKMSNKKGNTKLSKVKQQFVIAVTLSLLFGLGWGFGLPATNSISNVPLRTILQVIFILLTGFQGVFVFIMQCLRSQEARKEWKRWFNIVSCRPDRARAYSRSTDSRGYNGDNTLPKRYNKSATMSTSYGPWDSNTLRRAVQLDAIKRSVNNDDKRKPTVVFVNDGFEEKKDLCLEYSQNNPDKQSTVIANTSTMEKLEEESVDAGAKVIEKPNSQQAEPLTTTFAKFSEEDSSFDIMWVNRETASKMNEQTTSESCKTSPQQIELCNYTDGEETSLVVANTTELGYSQSVMDGKEDETQ